MHNIVGLIFRYRTLLGRKFIFDEKLCSRDEHRARTLGELFRDSNRIKSRRTFARVPVKRSATARLGRAAVDVELVDVGSMGACIVTTLPLGTDQNLVLLIESADGSCSYRFRAQVRWRKSDRIGLQFLGMPTCVSTDEPSGTTGDRAHAEHYMKEGETQCDVPSALSRRRELAHGTAQKSPRAALGAAA